MPAVAEREFGWSDETARKFVRVSEAFGAKFQPGWDLPIDTSALYLLAAPRVPEALRVEAVERAEAGERIAGCTDPCRRVFGHAPRARLWARLWTGREYGST